MILRIRSSGVSDFWTRRNLPIIVIVLSVGIIKVKLAGRRNPQQSCGDDIIWQHTYAFESAQCQYTKSPSLHNRNWVDKLNLWRSKCESISESDWSLEQLESIKTFVICTVHCWSPVWLWGTWSDQKIYKNYFSMSIILCKTSLSLKTSFLTIFWKLNCGAKVLVNFAPKLS